MHKQHEGPATEQHLHSFALDFEKFTTLDHSLGELLCERLKSALLITELEIRKKFFQEQLAILLCSFKKKHAPRA